MPRNPADDSEPVAAPTASPDSPADEPLASSGSQADPAPGEGGWDTAGFGSRFLAILVDWVLCLMIIGLVTGAPDSLWIYAILIAEYAIFMGPFTQTPGMWLAKVRCVSTSDARPIGVARALLRSVLMCLVLPVLIMDRYGRGLHDRAVGSIMLAAPRRRN